MVPWMQATFLVRQLVDLDYEVPERTFDPDNEEEVMTARRAAAIRAEELGAERWPDAISVLVEEVTERP